MEIKISALVGVNDCILAVYCFSNQPYRFSVVNASGRIYTCDTCFPTQSSAKLMGISVTERLAIDRDRNW
jgi:hypothetical protein